MNIHNKYNPEIKVTAVTEHCTIQGHYKYVKHTEYAHDGIETSSQANLFSIIDIGCFKVSDLSVIQKDLNGEICMLKEYIWYF